MLSLILLIVMIPINQSVERGGSDLHHRPVVIDTALSHMIQVRIVNENRMESFFMNTDSSTADIYRNAQNLGIIDATQTTTKSDHHPHPPKGTRILSSPNYPFHTRKEWSPTHLHLPDTLVFVPPLP